MGKVDFSGLKLKLVASIVAISGINFHDDNLNVIMRTKFAQPVNKRSSDKILFRTKLDF